MNIFITPTDFIFCFFGFMIGDWIYCWAKRWILGGEWVFIKIERYKKHHICQFVRIFDFTCAPELKGKSLYRCRFCGKTIRAEKIP